MKPNPPQLPDAKARWATERAMSDAERAVMRRDAPSDTPKPYADLKEPTKQLIDAVIFNEEVCAHAGIPLREYGMRFAADGKAVMLPEALVPRVAVMREVYAADIQKASPEYLAKWLRSAKRTVAQTITRQRAAGDVPQVQAMIEALDNLPYPPEPKALPRVR
jgi:hypothetical protein